MINTQFVVVTLFCLAVAAAHVAAINSERPKISGLAKAAASTSFVAVAVINNAADTSYGRFILAALALSLIGDLLLLSFRSRFLLGGIASFLLAHVAFAAAFTRVAVDTNWFAVAMVCAAIAGILLIRWLWPRLGGFYRVAVPVYAAAIVLMTSLAIGASAESMPSTVGVGAVLFAVSDVSVARDRFIERNIANKMWGLPLYYIAQLLFAGSVIAATRQANLVLP